MPLSPATAPRRRCPAHCSPSTYLGAVMIPEPNGLAGGVLCLSAIFLPSFLLVIGALPFWDVLRRRPQAQAALRGVNAAVVGLLLAALYDPVWTSGIRAPADFALAAAALLLLAFWQLPPWLVVIAAGAGRAAAGYWAHAFAPPTRANSRS